MNKQTRESLRVSAAADHATRESLSVPSSPPPFWRAILVGAILLPLAVYFGNYAYVVTQALLWGQTSLLRGPVFVLFLAALANLALRRVGRRVGLAPSELIVIYSMIAISTCISGFGEQQWLVNLLPAGHYYQTPTNHYERFTHFIPSYLTPNDPRVIHDFYIGHASFLRPDILADWARPVLVWSLFIFVLTTVTLCIASLVSRQWIQSERLTFPLVQLPLEMARGASDGAHGFFTSAPMWSGFALAGVLESIDYLNYFYPSLPYIQIKPHHLEPLLTTAPWNAIGTFTVAFYPFAIGIAFLLSLEVSFSCWFFYLLTRVENIATSAMGLNAGGLRGSYAVAPYLQEQGVGAFLALGIYLLWRARRTLTLKRDDSPADEGGLLPQRSALLIGVTGIVLLTAFLTMIGLPLWIALVFWAIYILIVLVLTRIVAEAGAGWAWAPGVPVHGVIMEAAGSSAMTARTLSLFGLLSWFDGELRDISMPHQLEAIKMQEETKGRSRQMLWALLIAAALTTIVGFATYLDIYYKFGAASASVRPALAFVGTGELSTVNNWLISAHGVDGGALRGMLAGAMIVTALAVLRQNFTWWPLHPLGYALAGTESMEYMWCPFLIGWLVKSLVLRYGGIRLYRRMLPFFLGLILGDYVVPMIWGFWGMATGAQVYMAFPH